VSNQQAKQMGKRSGVAETKEQVAKMTLDELNAEIERLLQMAYSGSRSAARKECLKRAVWLEQIREDIHGVTAKRRLWRDR
jgi:hypothetical protein